MTFTDWPWRHWRQVRSQAPALRLNDEVLSWRALCERCLLYTSPSPRDVNYIS
ncbi:hypothetical protein, partial [Salmonella enterica]|uniref:hypothetical protein n=1 Tax=Salmonella enterica TaxID=28901 RepID=UPI00217F1ADF